MREIKFRIWNPVTKIMIDLQNHKTLILNIDTEGLFIPFCSLPLMQFTGLKDSNGQDIYEGDILSQEGYSDWVVCWHDTGFHIYNTCNPSVKFPLPPITNRTIIGNIYANPELIK